MLQVAEPVFRDFGARVGFHGPIVTLKLFEEPRAGTLGGGAGGGSLRCALVGDMLAAIGRDSGWAGIVVNGCVRDSADLATIAIGIKALAIHPLRSTKRGVGERDVTVRFAGITFQPGHSLYADEDGLIVSAQPLALP